MKGTLTVLEPSLTSDRGLARMRRKTVEVTKLSDMLIPKFYFKSLIFVYSTEVVQQKGSSSLPLAHFIKGQSASTFS